MKKLSQLSSRDRQKRVKKLATDPGTRAKIPTSMLKGFAGADKLRAQRALNTRLNQPFVPGADLTNRDAAHQRDAAVRQKYGTVESELASQTQQNQAQQGRTNDFYALYKQQVEQGLAAQQAQQGQLASQLQGFSTGIRNADQPVLAQQQQAMQADAQRRGATVDPNVMKTAQDAAAARQALLSGFAAAQVNRAGADTSSLNALSTRVPLMGQEAGAGLRADAVKLGGQKVDLARDKGDYATRFTQDLKDSENKSVLERALFNVNATDKAADNARQDQQLKSSRYDKVQSRKLARKRVSIQEQNAATSAARVTAQKQAAAQKKAEKAAQTHNTKVAKNQAWRDKADGAMGAFSQIGKEVNVGTSTHPEMHKVTPDDVLRKLQRDHKADPLIAQVAWERHHNGGVSPATAAKLRKRGIGVPRAWLQKPPAPKGVMDKTVAAVKGALIS